MIKRLKLLATLTACGWVGLQAGAAAQTCSVDDFGKAVDSAGAALRAFNVEATPKLQAGIRALAAQKGWTDQETEEQAIAYLQDARLASLDETANSLLAKVDSLGRLEPGAQPDCAKLEDLKATGIELLAVMKAKSAHLIARIDAETGAKPAGAAPQTTVAANTQPPGTSAPASPTKPQPPAAITKVEPPPAKAPAPTTATVPSWSTSTSQTAVAAPPLPSASVATASPPPAPPSAQDSIPRPSVSLNQPAPGLMADDGFTIDEIRDATRGFFGQVSTGLASVIEHAFKKAGRPTAYILGQEGGGAFLGGLRYGQGTLYIRSGGTQKIYWHGPSVGFDFGAAGARTLFLVYKMRDPADLYRVFTGIDGSAFVVGGVGLTLLGGGGIVMAPIRSGIGVRVGANVGYLRFTSDQTWNPF